MKLRGGVPFTDEISLRQLNDARELLNGLGSATVDMDQYRIFYEVDLADIPESDPVTWISDLAARETYSASESQVFHAISIYLGLHDCWRGIREDLLALGFTDIPDPEADLEA